MSENRNVFEKSGEIDLVDFSGNREMDRIRENERIEREKRLRHAAKLRRAEMIRRKKIERIKTMVTAWAILIFAVIALVAIIIGVVSLFKGGDGDEENKKINAVSEAESTLLADFSGFDGAVYSVDNGEKNMPSSLNALDKNITKDIAKAVLSSTESSVYGSVLSMMTDAFLWNSKQEDSQKLLEIVRDYPVYSNGYVWSFEESMKHPAVNSYFYDTNASFVSAVCDICLWDGSTSFLDSIDMTGEENGDISAGMTVGEKLEKVVGHFFDFEDVLNGGGVRFNDEDGLVYVLTADNNGTESGKPSNVFYNYRFGYIDTYNNLVFNAAMQDLEALYTLMGDKENAEKYKAYAEQNKKAINQKLFDKKLGRYIGCIDKDGNVHDGGFTAVNLLAVSLGIADEEKTEAILSWIEGTRSVSSDTHKGANVYSSLATPAFSTVTAEDEWWYNAEGNYSLDDEAVFGEYWMNGGASALSGNLYLLAADSKADTRKRAYNIADSFENGKFALSEGERSEPALYYALAGANAVREVLGVSTDGKNLCIAPLFNDGENYGAKNISFAGRYYDFLFHNDTVYVMSSENAAVRLKIGSFGKNEALKLVTVEDGIVVSEETVSSDKSGVLSVSVKFGGKSYIRIEKAETQE